MQALSSFIPSYRPRRKTKTASTIASVKSPFVVQRLNSPRSPHPYASPEIFHITDRTSERSVPPPSEDEQEEEDHQFSYVRTVPAPPPMKLDVDLSPEPLGDWFPAHLLNSDTDDAYAGIVEGQPTPSGDGVTGEFARRNDVDGRAGNVQDDYDEDEHTSSTSEDFVANLEAMDASSFINYRPANDLNVARLFSPSPPVSHRKTAPAPIKIPNAALHGPKVQIIRSSALSPGPTSRPESAISLEESSAVSGTTLARALMGNSYVLSADIRSSRYRSGASNLTRTDSATLPRGEHPFLHSPNPRERKLSGTGNLLSPDATRSPIPPVPPIPSIADLASLPSRVNSRPVSHTGIQDRIPDADSLHPQSLSVNSDNTSQPASKNFHPSRRISRISEAPSSGPSTPEYLHVHNILGDTDESSQQSGSSPLGSDLPTSPDTRPLSESVSRPSSGATPLSPDIVSPAPSSAKDLENVLDYYQLVPTPGPGENGFRPPFSPISEESSSQYSPFISRRNSIRQQALSIGSPSSLGSGRIDFVVPRGASSLTPSPTRDAKQMRTALLPMGERFHSSQAVPATPSETSSPPLSSSLDVLGPLLPPSKSSIFNRQRSGSAPSPIRVVRDSRDLNSYNITVTPRPVRSNDSTPTTGDSDYVKQTFPETPNAFSPVWSPGAVGHRRELSNEYLKMHLAAPQAPVSAALPGGSSIGPSLAQQVLLTRAATSVRGARHSRQGSLNRARSVTRHLPPMPVIGSDSDVQLPRKNLPEENQTQAAAPTLPSEVAINDSIQVKSRSLQRFSQASVASSLSSYSVTDSNSPNSALTASKNAQGPSHPPSNPQSPQHTPDAPQSSQHTLNVTQLSDLHSSDSPSRPVLDLNDLPMLPQSSSESSLHSLQPQPSSSRLPSESSLYQPDQQRPPSSDFRQVHPHPPLPPSVIESRSQTDWRQPETPPVVVTPPPGRPPSPNSAPSFMTADLGSPYNPSFGSPPPYDALYEPGNNDGQTPSTGGSGLESHFSFMPGYSPSTSYNPRDRSLQARQSSSSINRRARMRPPLPAGPRRPSQPNTILSRQRNASVSSISSSAPGNSGRSRAPSSALPSPRFQTPPLKWRGYPMDAAKWTFTSAQLQTIVSRAIRQSSEASSIRLLRLETLDDEIPQELHRLDLQRTDAKTRYKMLTRRRTNLLESLSTCMDGSEPDDTAIALRWIQELKEVSNTLDKLAEDLHSADEQIAQLNTLRQVHSASALAMALRKLNASLLKQFGESEALRAQVGTLEAERDEAWKQAEAVANEYDHLQEKVVNSPDQQLNKRSSRVMASRKSSIRASKAGLRSSSISSSHRMSTSTLPSGARSAFSIDDVPPVPPIPRHRPGEIMTDLPPRSSAGMSTDGPTPNSETRAMLRAHQELCDMLGISMHDVKSRRSHSLTGRPRSAARDQVSPSTYSRPHSGASRPTSLPGSSVLVQEAFNAMTADRNAMLATLGMLSD